MNENKKRIKIKTVYGKILTITINEQTDQYISGIDKFGIFTKIQMDDIENCFPLGSNEQ